MWLRGKRRVRTGRFFCRHAALLQNRDAQAVQRQRVADNFPGSDAYYNYVLTLFGQGWDQHRFRFSTKGELLPDWGQECANSH
ncbi:hypothetical protein ECZU51_35670 [Escherichia coli]|nr:hypothetical protein ECZU51_35670 [Escherichia coli]